MLGVISNFCFIFIYYSVCFGGFKTINLDLSPKITLIFYFNIYHSRFQYFKCQRYNNNLCIPTICGKGKLQLYNSNTRGSIRLNVVFVDD